MPDKGSTSHLGLINFLSHILLLSALGILFNALLKVSYTLINLVIAIILGLHTLRE